MKQGTFEFLNQKKDLQFPPKWNGAKGVDLLWLYNLHYFEWIHELSFDDAKRVVEDWIVNELPHRGSASWAPYPTSLRILNWTQYFYYNHRDKLTEDQELCSQLWKSLFCQATYLRHNLETHLLGNHLFENITAMAFLGACIGGTIGREWREIGEHELATEITEQFLPDGLHFELSPMYHIRMTYLLYLLHSTGHSHLQDLVEAPLRRALLAVEKMCHPDGKIALFNDSTFGIYHEPNELIKHVSEHLECRQKTNSNAEEQAADRDGSWALKDAGYYGYRDAEGNCLVCDIGPIGPDYIPGHAHADLLSYELSLRSHRVIVDTGNFEYVIGARRDYARSTRAHNTIEINGTNQCDLWGAFRVGRRGYPKDVQFCDDARSFSLAGGHSGYERLPAKSHVKRRFELTQPIKLTVTDEISSKHPVEIKSFINLAPNCRIINREDQRATIAYPEGSFSIQFSGDGLLSEETTSYFPEFGLEQSRKTLCYAVKGKDILISYTLTPC